MDDIRKLISIEIHRRVSNPKFYLALVLTLCVMVISFDGLTKFLVQHDMQIQAAELFVFIVSDRFTQWMLTFSFLILVGDAPFIQDGMDILLMRTNKKKWLTAQSIVMICMIMIWLVVLEISVLLLTAGHISWKNEWSDYIYLAARLQSGTRNMGIGVNTSMLPLTEGTPLVLFGIAFLYAVLLFTYFGMWGIVANLLTGRSYGSCIAACFLAFRFALNNLVNMPALKYISPANLIDLTSQSIQPPMIIYTVLFFVIQIVILAWIAEWILKKRDVCKLR